MFDANGGPLFHVDFTAWRIDYYPASTRVRTPDGLTWCYYVGMGKVDLLNEYACFSSEKQARACIQSQLDKLHTDNLRERAMIDEASRRLGISPVLVADEPDPCPIDAVTVADVADPLAPVLCPGCKCAMNAEDVADGVSCACGWREPMQARRGA